MSDEILLALWQQATEAEIGIGVTIDEDDRKWFVNHLYRVRQESGIEELEEIILLLPKLDEIFLCKKQTNL